MAFHGSCRTQPNKFQLIDMAYQKIGIENGSILLKQFLFPLIGNPSFKLQQLCKPSLIESEINIINCLQDHKNDYVNNKYYINLWNLENNKEAFTRHCKNLAKAFKSANLDTSLHSNTYKEDNIHTFNSISKTLH